MVRELVNFEWSLEIKPCGQIMKSNRSSRFQVHTNLIRSVVWDTSLLPITPGVAWRLGYGKSNFMKMLERDLNGTGILIISKFHQVLLGNFVEKKGNAQ